MKKNIILLITFSIGLSIFLYPIITNYISYQNGLWQIKTYEQSIKTISEEDYTNILSDAQKYNEDLINNYEDIIEDKKRYYNQINIPNTDIMGYIYIEKLNIDLPIYHGMEDAVLQVGIGHFEGSSLPIGGEGTHSALLGHRGLPTAKLFTHLDKLKIGDVFTIKILKEKLFYKVDKIDITEPDEVLEKLKIEENKDLVTLVTCTPYGINTERLLVRGTRVDEGEISKTNIEKIFNKNYNKNILTIVTIIVLVIIIISIIITSVHQKNKNKKKVKKTRHDIYKKYCK